MAGSGQRRLTSFTDLSACATLRLSAHSSAMPCSAAAMVFAVGAFTTKQPNWKHRPVHNLSYTYGNKHQR